jgi:hypothetical protein
MEGIRIVPIPSQRIYNKKDWPLALNGRDLNKGFGGGGLGEK